MAVVGRSSLLNSVEPVLQVLQWVVDYPVSVFQQVVVFLQKGCSAFCKLPPDFREELTSLSALLGSDGGGVDVVAVFPHLPYHQPQLVDQLGAPGCSRLPAVLVFIVVLLVVPYFSGDPAQHFTSSRQVDKTQVETPAVRKN